MQNLNFHYTENGKEEEFIILLTVQWPMAEKEASSE